ncbi:MAG: thymidine kinase [Bdellovibrionaceae bacterium]|nr:thymidine kinase [Pseudobdellovibrionaceae bacterium]|tara:strand:+ start:2895 stop:3536 length:642 start_codon:yes stop_codon:yes gene_type:complete
MHFHQMVGSIEIVCGSMFSGKTEELLRRVKRAQIARQKVQVFKPLIDDRYSLDHVQSHNAARVPSIPVQNAKEILEKMDDNTRVVGIDEVQFFDKEIVDVVQKLAYRGIQVVCAGLDMDFRGLPFGPMADLMCVAEKVTKLQAVCMVCAAPATRSQKVFSDQGQNENQIDLGAHDKYEARCRFCHEPEGVHFPAHQIGLRHARNEDSTNEEVI